MNATPMPSQAQIENAREDLERAQFKLGKVQARAILSAATAKSDKIELDRASKARDEAEESYTNLVERFTNIDRIAEATQAIRAQLQPVDYHPAAAGGGHENTPRHGPLFGERAAVQAIEEVDRASEVTMDAPPPPPPADKPAEPMDVLGLGDLRGNGAAVGD